jgi:peptidoglycan/xylan/chitin deacetylase (PgdA/CDA1 family)
LDVFPNDGRRVKLRLNVLARLLRPILSAAAHLKLMPESLVCPVYHTAWSGARRFWNGRYAVKSIRQLEQDLDVLQQTGEPVSLHDLLEWSSGRRPRPRGWFLSFDDGYRELATEIAPLLQRRGIPATFFLCSSLIDNQQAFFEDFAGWVADALQGSSEAALQAAAAAAAEHGLTLAQALHSRVPRRNLLCRLAEIVQFDVAGWLASEQPYLTSGQVRELLAAGFTIGAHSLDHPLFSEITPGEGLRQVQHSLQWLNERFQVQERVFAFPYGEFDLPLSFLRSLQGVSGLQMLFGTRGIVQDELEPFIVQRMLAEGHPGSFRSHLRNELNLQLQRKLSGRGIVRRRADAV